MLILGCGQLPLVGSDGGSDADVADVDGAPYDAHDEAAQLDAIAPDVSAKDVSIDVVSDVADATTFDAVTDAGDAGDGGPNIVTLATGQSSIVELTVDNSNVYWTAAKTVMSCSVNGCGQPTALVTNAPYSTTSIATDGVNVYFQAGYASACAVGGCNNSPTQLSEGGSGLATDGSYVFYADGTHPGLAKCSISGCTTPPPMLISGGNYNQFAVDGTNVYWTNRSNGSEVYSCAKTGCSSGTLIADGQGGVNAPEGIATDGKNVYWANSGSGTIQQCAVTGCNDQPTTLATAQNNPLRVATDGVNVYWVEQGAGNVRKCAVGGCSNKPTTLASGQTSPSSIAVDSTSVYWVEYGVGNVKKTPK